MTRLKRHRRFLLAFALGLILAAFGFSIGQPRAKAAILGFDGFALAYLWQMARHAGHTSAAALKHHAQDEDEGIALILTLALIAVTSSLAAIGLLLIRPEGGTGALTAVLAIAAVPLGWAVLHTLAAFRYAHLHYEPSEKCKLAFPGTPEPGPWDFLYFAFTVGMTAQTSDVAVTTSRMRRAVLAHSALAFFYNTVILALAINAGLALLA